MINISYGITVNDEFKEIKLLINKILSVITDNDEIVIIQDNSNFNDNWNKVNGYLLKLQNKYNNIIYDNTMSLNNNFSKFKNYMIKLCNKDWIVHFDADEYPNKFLLQNVKEIIKLNPVVDLYWVPRINIVHGITEEYIQQMRWTINDDGWINWPNDYQQRIWKNKNNIIWNGIVHERLINATKQSFLPLVQEYSYYHIKSFKKQKKQNILYDKIKNKDINNNENTQL